MAPTPAAVVAGIAMIASGALVVALRRPSPFSLAVFGLLALWGGATMAASGIGGATTLSDAQLAARLTIWYSLPLPFLFLFVMGTVVDEQLATRLRIVLAALAILTVAGLAALALDPTHFVANLPVVAGSYALTSGRLLYVLTATTALIEAYVAVVAARGVLAASATAIERDRRAWIAVAAAIVPLHAGAFFVAFIATGPPSLTVPLFWVRAIPTLAAGAFAAYALTLLGRADRQKGMRLALGVVVLVLGLVDGVVGGRRLLGAVYPGYETSAAIIRAGFAFFLCIAVLRFGLADAGSAIRRLVARVSAAAFGIATAVVVMAATSVLMGSSPLALGVASVIGVSAPLALRTQIASAGRSLAARLLLPPDDPRAVAERARTYAAAVAAARGAGSEGELLLASMRADLGISEKEHELLVHGVASRDQERYQTIQTLGTGATADVSLAVDEVAGKRVVVKRFRALRDPGRVLREARAMAAVRHPRVVPFLEVDRRGDEVYLVLAYAEGGSARQLLDKAGPLGVQQAIGLTKDLLDGLEALHAQGIVHCDVKPENLLLDAEGRGMLGDFGSAKFAAPDVADATLTGADAEGSLSTVSPEALRGEPPASTRDVYAAGATLYRLLTGQHYVALEETTVFEARQRILLDAPRLPHARIPASVEAVLRKALAKRPDNRYQSAREMRDALR